MSNELIEFASVSENFKNMFTVMEDLNGQQIESNESNGIKDVKFKQLYRIIGVPECEHKMKLLDGVSKEIARDIVEAERLTRFDSISGKYIAQIDLCSQCFKITESQNLSPSKALSNYGQNRLDSGISSAAPIRTTKSIESNFESGQINVDLLPIIPSKIDVKVESVDGINYFEDTDSNYKPMPGSYKWFGVLPAFSEYMPRNQRITNIAFYDKHAEFSCVGELILYVANKDIFTFIGQIKAASTLSLNFMTESSIVNFSNQIGNDAQLRQSLDRFMIGVIELAFSNYLKFYVFQSIIYAASKLNTIEFKRIKISEDKFEDKKELILIFGFLANRDIIEIRCDLTSTKIRCFDTPIYGFYKLLPYDRKDKFDFIEFCTGSNPNKNSTAECFNMLFKMLKANGQAHLYVYDTENSFENFLCESEFAESSSKSFWTDDSNYNGAKIQWFKQFISRKDQKEIHVYTTHHEVINRQNVVFEANKESFTV